MNTPVDPESYLRTIEAALIESPVIRSYVIVRRWANTDDGYIRIRATLVNGDFLELAEYFVVEGSQIRTVDYRHQWMAADKRRLRRRWDSTPDHPHLPNFPYHVHVEEETNVHPDQPRSILNILTELEHAILNFGSS